eukprot:GFYU01010701.1.p1 GENE.GFYU01010701.1~~GFYU01010701.1.p1  ORF type:complete len:128 (+),score=5.46 GFYU01010701.1:122-505(+)
MIDIASGAILLVAMPGCFVLGLSKPKVGMAIGAASASLFGATFARQRFARYAFEQRLKSDPELLSRVRQLQSSTNPQDGWKLTDMVYGPHRGFWSQTTYFAGMGASVGVAAVAGSGLGFGWRYITRR